MRIVIVFGILFFAVLFLTGTYLVIAGSDGSVPPSHGSQWLYELQGVCAGDGVCTYWYTFTGPAKMLYWGISIALFTLIFYGLPKTSRKP